MLYQNNIHKLALGHRRMGLLNPALFSSMISYWESNTGQLQSITK